jgi:hypothetical protein
LGFLAAPVVVVQRTAALPVPLAAQEIRHQRHQHRVTTAALLLPQTLTTVPAAVAALVQPVALLPRLAQAVTAVPVKPHQSAERLLFMPVVVVAQATTPKEVLEVPVAAAKAVQPRESLG